MCQSPALPGSYLILFDCAKPGWVEVGRLGGLALRRGGYLYAGSAMGPGGIRARVGHHLRQAARPRWHLDWLRPFLRPQAVWWAAGPARYECAWAAGLAHAQGAEIPLAGFGASDCRSSCAAHLVFFGTMGGLSGGRLFVEKIMEGLPGPGVDRGRCDLAGPADQVPGA